MRCQVGRNVGLPRRLFLATALSLIFLCRVASAGTWSTAGIVNPDPESLLYRAANPSLSATGSNGWIVAWNRLEMETTSTHGRVVSAYSSDGITWTPPVVIFDDDGNSTTGAYLPVVAGNHDGTCIVVWDTPSLHGTIGGMQVSRSLNRGATWSTATRIGQVSDSMTAGIYHKEMATDGFGRWMLVWTFYVPGYGGFTFDVAYSASEDNGATWSPAAKVQPNYVIPARPTALLTSGTQWLLGMVDVQGHDAFDVRAYDSGSGWTDLFHWNPYPPKSISSAALGIDHSGRIAVLYSEVSAMPIGPSLGNAYVTRSVDGGSSWSTAELVAGGLYGGFQTESDGRARFLAFPGMLGSIAHVSYNSGDTWTATTPPFQGIRDFACSPSGVWMCVQSPGSAGDYSRILVSLLDTTTAADLWVNYE